MKTLEKILEKDAIVLEEGQLYACLGGSCGTNETTYTNNARTGLKCECVTVDTYDKDGQLVRCTTYTCEEVEN